MAHEELKIQNLFLGGIADSKYSVSRNSVAYAIGCDIRSELGVISANQNLKPLATGSVPTEPPVKLLTCTNGNVYHFSKESGKIWELNTSNSWSLVYTVAPVFGDANILDAIEYSDYIYFSTENYLHRIRISKTSDWTTNAEPNYKPLMLDQATLGFNTDLVGYAAPTSITENAANSRYFKPIENVLSGIGIFINAKGSANATITVHDASNTLVTSLTINNADLVVGKENFFKFSPIVAIDPDQTYHYHVTGNVSGILVGTKIVASPATPALSDAYTNIYTKSFDQYHSFAISNLVLYIGDRNYIHQIENDPRTGEHVFSYFALDIPRGFNVSAIEGWNTNLVVGTIAANNVNKAHIFWWNTFSTVSFSYEDQVEETGINSFQRQDNNLFVNAGSQGRTYQYVQGQLQWDRQIPGNYNNVNKGIIHLNASTYYSNALMFGFSALSGNPAPTGVYSVMQARPKYPFVLNIEYAISKRNGSALVINQISITAVTVRDTDLIIGWKDNVSSEVGVDIIDWDNKHDGAEIVTGVVKSNEQMFAYTLKQLIVDYAELPTGTDIIIDYKKNNSDTYTTPTTTADPFHKYKIVETSDECVSVEARARLVCSGNNSPKIYGIYFGLN